MRFPIFLTFTFIVLFQFNSTAQVNTSLVPRSEESHGFTFDFDKVKASIIDRINHPNERNDYITLITEDKSFPKLLPNEALDESFYLKLKNWIETHQSIVIAVFKQRKDIVQEF
jgi:hypothetical protein